MKNQPAIDPSSIEALRAVNPDDNGEFLREIIDIFLSDTPKRITDLKTAYAGGDGPTVGRMAHTMKGSAGNFGAGSFSEVARDIETKVREGKMQDIARLIPALDSEFQRVKAALLEEVDRSLG